jgi:hypothetical protein
MDLIEEMEKKLGIRIYKNIGIAEIDINGFTKQIEINYEIWGYFLQEIKNYFKSIVKDVISINKEEELEQEELTQQQYMNMLRQKEPIRYNFEILRNNYRSGRLYNVQYKEMLEEYKYIFPQDYLKEMELVNIRIQEQNEIENTEKIRILKEMYEEKTLNEETYKKYLKQIGTIKAIQHYHDIEIMKEIEARSRKINLSEYQIEFIEFLDNI